MQFDRTQLANNVKTVLREGYVDAAWSTGVQTSIALGDRIYILYEGPDGPGIIGRGVARSDVFLDEQDSDPKLDRRYVTIRFDRLVDPSKSGPVIPKDLLQQRIRSGQNWDPQSSASRISEEVLPELETLFDQMWEQRAGGMSTTPPSASLTDDLRYVRPKLFPSPEGRFMLSVGEHDDIRKEVELRPSTKETHVVIFSDNSGEHVLDLLQIYDDSEDFLSGSSRSLGLVRFERIGQKLEHESEAKAGASQLKRLYPSLAGPLLPLFERLDARLHSLGSDVVRLEKAIYIGYGRPKLFLKVLPQSQRLFLHLLGVAGQLHDPRNLRDPNTVAPLYGNEHVALHSLDELDHVMELVSQAYTLAITRQG